MALSDLTSSALRRITIERQSKGRVPGVAAGVVRNGELVWHAGVGSADLDEPGRPPGADDQFLIASITKTFTAVMVMQLRDEGRLSLERHPGEVPARGGAPRDHRPSDAVALVGHAAGAGG
jgi:CubicO group peptidase (beta-lactamase class C family)